MCIILKISVRLQPSDIDSWVLLNPQVNGFYRVQYDLKTWDLLIDQLMLEHYVTADILFPKILIKKFILRTF